MESDTTANENAAQPAADDAAKLTKLHELPQKEVSAVTIARMMGLPTATEFKMLEGKLDLLSTKMSNLTVRLEKAITMLGSCPTGSDLERVDVQIGALKQVVLEALGIAVKDDGKKGK